ncbi:MAG: coenzyme F420 hydrogenase, partial [Coriobacteriia bacterium]|nr:coenzyme F420 hydrogenase [Coriobacteriia bacterium]
ATIAAASERYGDGRVHLTSRQAVEIPYVKLEDIDAIKAELAAGGVETAQVGARVRTVTACQGSEVCRHGCIETYPLAVELDGRYTGRKLPHKFKIGITGCANNCLKAEENDLGIKGGYAKEWLSDACNLCEACLQACRHGAISLVDDAICVDKTACVDCGRCVQACAYEAWDAEPGFILSFGGTFGNSIAIGERILPIITDREVLLRVADATVAYFQEHGQPGERFRTTIERTGWAALRQAMEEANTAVEATSP